MTTEVPYNRHEPDYWDEIISQATLLAPENGERPRAMSAVKEMLGFLDGYDNELVTEYAYYGLGLGLCHMLPTTSEPSVKQNLAARLRDSFVAWDIDPDRLFDEPLSGIATERISRASLEAISPLTIPAFKMLPAARHFAADSLVAAMHIRRHQVQVPFAPLIYPLEHVESGEEAAHFAASDATAGAIEAIGLAVRTRPREMPALGTQDIKCKHFMSAAARIAGLHLEEFSNEVLLQQLFYTDSSGRLVPNRKVQLPQPPRLPGWDMRRTTALHRDRQGCPARGVGGLELLKNFVEITWDATLGWAELQRSDQPDRA